MLLTYRSWHTTVTTNTYLAGRIELRAGGHVSEQGIEPVDLVASSLQLVAQLLDLVLVHLGLRFALVL